MQLRVIIVLCRWLGYIIHVLISGKNLRFYKELGKCQINGDSKNAFSKIALVHQKIYKKKLPYIVQATNEALFLSWTPGHLKVAGHVFL